MVREKILVPLWEKYMLTREEAAEYFRIGENRLSEWIRNNPNHDCICWVGNRALIKRKKFESYLDNCNVF